MDFIKLLFNTHLSDIEKYAKQKITYKSRLISSRYVVVEGITRDQSDPVSLNYSLHLKDGNWTVYDVAVDGISLVPIYRSQFDSILADSSFDDLFRMLKRKTAKVCGSNRC